MSKESSITSYATVGDEQLVHEIQQHKADSVCLIEELLRRHHVALLHRCHHYLQNLQDAEDAVQETELRVLRAIDAFKGEAAFRTWLFAIADNQCHTLAARRMRNLMGDHLRALLEYTHERAQLDHQNESDRLALFQLVSSVMNALPAQASEILSLRFYADQGIEEIARILGIGLSAAKMRLYRSLRLAEAMFLGRDQRLCA